MIQIDEVKRDSKQHNSVLSLKIEYIIKILAHYIYLNKGIERSQMTSSKFGVFRPPPSLVIYRHFCHPLDDAIFHQPQPLGFLFLRCSSEKLFSMVKLKITK